MSEWESDDSIERIAIVGMSGRFPGANTLEQFWRNLRAGVESVSVFTDEELLAAGVPAEALRSPEYVRARGVVEGVELFDAQFFGFNPREAELTDPQHRLFLECSWEAIEQAGYDPERYEGLIGVFAGSSLSRYGMRLLAGQQAVGAHGVFQFQLSNGVDHLPTQVSYRLNLRGPSIAVQTSCSSSLVAVQLACQSLLNYQCDMALAGGASIIVPQQSGYFYHEGGTHSPDGRCRAFDAKARGMVEGNGVGVVLLKRLSEALEQGDYIHAVIRGVAANNDGARKVGYTAPSVEGHVEVISAALVMAGVEAGTVGYVEAHGTGTALGDPIEVEALTRAFRASTPRRGFCALGSLKTNIGHADAAAGVAGLIKAALCVREGELAPTLHFEEPNPALRLDDSPFYVNARLRAWDGPEPRRAGVSSFGIGGTNAHVVLEQAPERGGAGGTARRWHVLPVSAKSEAALEQAAANLAAHLEDIEPGELADVAYTLQVGRREMPHRRVVVCRGVEDAVAALRVGGETQITEHRNRPVVFMFPGQGAQHVGAGQNLYETEPTFRESLDECAELLLPHLGADLRELLYPSPERREDAARELNQTYVTQPALFAVEYALARLWESWGVRPEAMIGHSVGEYVAACLAGVMTLEDALMVVAARGRLMQSLPPGSMLAVQLAPEEAESVLGDGLSLAAVNGPARCVVSGPTEAVEALARLLAERGVASRRLNTSHAFHSGMVEGVLDEFVALLGRVRLSPPSLPYLSNVTGRWITDEEATDPRYWARHMRQTVRFSDGLAELSKEPGRVLLEVGPGNTLAALARRNAGAHAGQVIVSSLPSASDESDDALLFDALGRLWLAGASVDWQGFHAGEQRRRLPLPTYPFQRQRYWSEPEQQQAAEPGGPSRRRPHEKAEMAEWFYTPSWKRSPPPELLPQSAHAGQSRHWTVFVDGGGLGSRIVEELRRAGRDVVIVTAGEHFDKLAADAYQLAPGQAEDYERLLRALAAEGRFPDKVLHLWSIGGGDDAQRPESAARVQDRGFYSLLFLAKALGGADSSSPVEVEVVTDGAQELSGEGLRPEHATLLGQYRVIPQEYPHIACRVVDVRAGDGGGARPDELTGQLLTEFHVKPSDAAVAYRGSHRWVQTFEPVRLEGDAGRGGLLREGGVYLLTGGLGNVGSALALCLAREARARLVLFGRTGLPPREEWERRAAAGDEPELARKIGRVLELEAAGAEVLLVSGDVASREDVAAAVRLAVERFGGLHGVIHAAGAAGAAAFRSIRDLTAEECESQFRSKVYGTEVLAEALRDQELDFCLLVSSLSSVLGGLGFSAYAAANSFMDAFALARRQSPAPLWMSVNWDGWQGEEQGAAAGRGAGSAGLAITREEGVEAFRRVLRSRATQLIVSTGDLSRRLREWARPLDAEARDAAATPPAAHPRPEMRNSFVAPRGELELAVASIWRELLGIEEVGAHDDFFALNGDSLLATQLIARARKVFQADVPVAAFFERPTVSALAETIEAHEAVPGRAQKIARALNSVRGMSAADVNQALGT